MTASPTLGPRARSDPALTLAKLSDVLSDHCGIVTSVRPLAASARDLGGAYGYAATLETLTPLGNGLLRARRERSTDWLQQAEGRGGTRVAFDRSRAFVRAVGEALERYASTIYDPDTLATGSYHELKARALDPRTTQLPDEREYNGLPELAPFDERAPMRWARGWSLRDAMREVLVPAQMTHLFYNPIPGEPRFVPPTSTGWAIHHSREEAIHAGLREVIERDAFALAWLHRWRLPEVAIEGAEAERFAARVRREGAELHVRSLMTDVGIPVFAAMVVDRRPGRPAFLLTTAAHPDPRRGLLQAIEEAAMIQHHAARRMRDLPPAKPAERIESMADHQDHYLRPENLPALASLLDHDGSVHMRDLPQLGSDDVWAEARAMIDRLARVGLDTLYVDGTPSDLRAAGWHAAKTIVPGAVRHEYGYGVRLLACRRIYEAPVRMGKRATAPTRDELNETPHPYA